MAKSATTTRDTVAAAAERGDRKPRGVPIKVRATALGYYGEARRRPGDVFTIYDEQDFAESWMERVAPDTPERITSGAEALRQQHEAEIAARRQPGERVGPDTPTGAKDVLGE